MTTLTFIPSNIFPDTETDSDVKKTTDSDTGQGSDTPEGLRSMANAITSTKRDDPSLNIPTSIREPSHHDTATGNNNSVGDSSTQAPSHPSVHSNDLAAGIPGLYRVLDLIHERGSGGLVDKIIIEQESLGRFINALRPHAYTSITKVDFSALDQVDIRPIGIYGTPSAIIDYLKKKEIVDENTAIALLRRTDVNSGPSLRSGIYLLAHGPQDVYVIYWPEDTTWDDGAASSVCRNRITFMRYLTKIADQVVCLLSDEHAEAIVWRDEVDFDDEDIEDDEGDRLFAFEVSKTHEQQEGVSSRPGFLFKSELIHEHLPPSDCEADVALFRPRLATGETEQAIFSGTYVPAEKKERVTNEVYYAPRLKETLQRESVRLGDALSLDAIMILLDAGLKHGAAEAVENHRKAMKEVAGAARDAEQRAVDDLINHINAESSILLHSLEEYLMSKALQKFPLLAQAACAKSNGLVEPTSIPLPVDEEYLQNLSAIYPPVDRMLREACETSRFDQIAWSKYKKLKERILGLDYIFRENDDLDEKQREELVTTVIENKLDPSSPSNAPGWISTLRGVWDSFRGTSSSQQFMDVPRTVHQVNDRIFLSRLGTIADAWPTLAGAATEVASLARQHLREYVKKVAPTLRTKIQSIQREECRKQISRKSESDKTRQLKELRDSLLKALVPSIVVPPAPTILTIEDIAVAFSSYHSTSYRVAIRSETHSEPLVRYTMYPLELRQEDCHLMQQDANHIPTPRMHPHSAITFSLPAYTYILYLHLLPASRCILITRDRLGDCHIYASSTTGLPDAVRRRATKELKRDKIGENFMLSYDENKRILAACGVSGDLRLQLNTFAFDESYLSLQGMGSAVNLRPWYDGNVSIRHMKFVSGSEKLLFVDDYARARVYSMVTQQFRPAMLQLPALPSTLYTAPDGSCFFAVFPAHESTLLSVRAYHWSSFGSSDGIQIDIPQTILVHQDTTITSLMSRSNVYLLSLDTAERALRSVAFAITRKVTEFTFKEKGGPSHGGGRDQSTRHNSLVDCHADVWTRFPVLPAVRRETIISSVFRERRSLTFVSNTSHGSFESHFSALIDEFERTTRKPIGDELSNIRILAVDHETFAHQYPFTPSTFRAGEWLVELLCLIPIHIAVTRDNRFIPLKDGVWSAELERSLLGADVAKIVDSISFGWYESLFQSYMAKKPVKVVSSMGEQSVGKSFTLNHLVDTSFAGSAMRTTEGVWMSVTPTEDALIVALDFEGVHSIERSAQEDTLLVLFNTAISNLVLFRNNFALSRDITGLFQSFQSSALVLDPEANPMLFQSTLVIIIKDVVESDKNEIKKEFHLKFQQIVQAEQGMNFITRLHRNRLDIVPWPVIESKQFYTLFKAIKRRLDQQAITHFGGAVFLQTMKTLMAKLKANDWGSMSQNLATHRAQLILSLLPNALVFGATEVVPDFEPLTDYNTAAIIDVPDTRSCFYIGDAGPHCQSPSREDALQQLFSAWGSYADRFNSSEAEWHGRLQAALDDLADMRIEHVRSWLHTNTAKFPSTHADIQALHRKFDGLAIDLKASVHVCEAQCGSCNLICTLGHHHDASHDCRTDHRCLHTCQYMEEFGHDSNEACGLPAGHPGPHLCDVTAHLCGQPCKLSDKRGCQKACVKTIDHKDEDHMCAATVHECGMPCSLSCVRLRNGQMFSCDQSCGIASMVPHSEHRCNSHQCPITCQLCKRLCAERDHLHGLDLDAVHLCGQEHPCASLCGAQGICHIETAPMSVEATFTGRHESFQYTKYTQVSKRLPCVVPISAGEVEHRGEHTHDLGLKCFHYCETRCPDCGYFCTLPLGHTQQEHETSHGSMSKTKWAVDGPEGTVLEVEGRKFGTNDDGAPMLCSMYCKSMGRHVHVDWCRADTPRSCGGPEHEHINTPMQPHPRRPKDWITHSLYWKRTGFKDPYSQEDQANFVKCDRMCGGPEHNATAQAPAQPSYCTLPILHPRQTLDQAPPGGLGYISNDGHAFLCRNPAVLRQAFHVIFVIDRSGSMTGSDRGPLDNTPTSQLIRRRHNNRLGAVCSSLQGFWEARHHAVVAAAGAGGGIRRDAYTVILFNHTVATAINHDFHSEPVNLLNTVLQYHAYGGTDFTSAIQTAKACMENRWSTERTPVIIFLSDGECSIEDETMQDLCRSSIALGKPLSFHAVVFGPNTGILRHMAQIARDVESRAPQDPMNPHAGVPSSYTEALDTVRLAETFLGIADSLAKPRGALLRG